MVDEIEVAARSQAASMAVSFAMQQPANYGAAKSSASNPLPGVNTSLSAINDAVQLSADARDLVKQMRESKSVVEAWLDHVTKPPKLGDSMKPTDGSNLDTSKDGDKKDNPLQQPFDQAVNDIGWLFEALGLPKVDSGVLAQVLAAKMAADGVGTTPPVPEVLARAEASGNAAALFFENVGVTVQDGKVVDATVDRVALTTVHDSMRDRFTAQDRPVVVDVGGDLQTIAPQALHPSEEDLALAGITINPDDTDPTGKTRGQDQQHALLIVREGKLVGKGTARLKLDALLTINGGQ